jgi:hypothetical protein
MYYIGVRSTITVPPPKSRARIFCGPIFLCGATTTTAARVVRQTCERLRNVVTRAVVFNQYTVVVYIIYGVHVVRRHNIRCPVVYIGYCEISHVNLLHVWFGLLYEPWNETYMPRAPQELNIIYLRRVVICMEY